MKILLIDIETAPHRVYSWGLYNQDIGVHKIEEPGYTMCVAWKWLGSKHVGFKSMHRNGNDMISTVHALLNEADAVVHYNGTKFDIPTLNREFVELRMLPPKPFKQVDLLPTVRKKFKFASNKLDYVCRRLGLGGKFGHKGMELWKGCMEGDEASWIEMEKYNRQDVEILEKLYNAILPWIANHPNHALYNGAVDHTCPSCGSHNLQKRGFAYTLTGKYQQYACNDCGSWSRGRFTLVDVDQRNAVMRGNV